MSEELEKLVEQGRRHKYESDGASRDPSCRICGEEMSADIHTRPCCIATLQRAAEVADDLKCYGLAAELRRLAGGGE